MKCNRCGKVIDELEIFCDECKKELKKFSSKNEVNELEELIENQKKLNDLENTKELVDLDKLVEEELEKEEKIEEETQTFEVPVETRESRQQQKKEEFLVVEKSPNKKRKKKLIIIISIVAVLIISLILLFIFLNKEKEDDVKEIVIDYKKVINTYGKHITDIISEYKKNNGDIPTWQYVVENIDYDRYEVECSNHNIYSDGSVYLSECKVNDKKVKYIYGKEKEEEKVGKQISVYKEEYNGQQLYSNESNSYSTLVGTITCKTEDCSFVSAYDKYVLINEQNEYFLYDYINDSINFGPFLFSDTLVDNNTLYGILYKEDNKNNIYNVQTGKVLKNVKGNLLLGEMRFDPTIMYKYNYVIFENNGKNDFINLKTGNISYTIEEKIGEFIEDSNKKIVYIKSYTNDPNKFKIYNSNGKLLFGGKEYSTFIMRSNNFLVANDTNFRVYDNDLNLKTDSKNYDKIFGLYEEFVVALKGKNLIILSLEDEVYASFENSWESNYTFYDAKLQKNRISVIVENKKISTETKGRYIEYYYELSSKNSGFNEKNNI